MNKRVNIALMAGLLLVPGCSTLTGEKRIRQPLTAHYSVEDAAFRNSLDHLLGAPLVAGNRVTPLLNGDEIFPAMLAAIRAANQSVTLETFLWRPGQVSAQFVAALGERARAGVKVHVIVDGFGSKQLDAKTVEQLTSAGVKFAKYNPPFLFGWLRANHRTHRKLLVVDGRIGFTGGVCLSDGWLGNAQPPHWRDTHFRLEGPVVPQLQAAFADNWLQVRSELLHGESYFPPDQKAGNMTAQCFKSGPGQDAENAQLVHELSVAAARSHVRLAHAYFLPDRALVDAFLAARRRGVKIEIIVPGKTDNVVVRQAARSCWGELLKAGVEFYEYQPTLFHCKIMIVDDVWVTAGSINFDERSFRMNDEANINVLDRAFAARLVAIFDADKNQSRRLTLKDYQRRNWVAKACDHFFGLFRAQL